MMLVFIIGWKYSQKKKIRNGLGDLLSITPEKFKFIKLRKAMLMLQGKISISMNSYSSISRLSTLKCRKLARKTSK